MRYVLWFIFFLLLAACSQTPPAPAPRPVPGHATSVVVPRAPAGSHPATPVPAVPASAPAVVAPPFPLVGAQPGRVLQDGSRVPAVQGLLQAADRSLRAGDTDAAVVDLERAQRLAPQSSVVYQRLADVRLRQKRPAEAEQLARKGLAFAVGSAQQAVLWRQIAAARQLLGQVQGAQEALARAAVLEGPVTP